jgi:hypothetical protein
MKHTNRHSYCVAISGKQPVPAFWLNTPALSLDSIRGTMNLECLGVREGWDD